MAKPLPAIKGREAIIWKGKNCKVIAGELAQFWYCGHCMDCNCTNLKWETCIQVPMYQHLHLCFKRTYSSLPLEKRSLHHYITVQILFFSGDTRPLINEADIIVWGSSQQRILPNFHGTRTARQKMPWMILRWEPWLGEPNGKRLHEKWLRGFWG